MIHHSTDEVTYSSDGVPLSKADRIANTRAHYTAHFGPIPFPLATLSIWVWKENEGHSDKTGAIGSGSGSDSGSESEPGNKRRWFSVGDTENGGAKRSRAVVPAPAPIQIFIKTTMGKITLNALAPSESIESVRLMLQEKEGFPTYQQRLIFAGRQLEDGRSLADYKIGTKSTINLILIVRGC